MIKIYQIWAKSKSYIPKNIRSSTAMIYVLSDFLQILLRFTNLLRFLLNYKFATKYNKTKYTDMTTLLPQYIQRLSK